MTFGDIATLLRGDVQAERVVQKRGIVARLTVLTAAIMAFLAVFVLVLSLSAQRLADSWAADLSQTSTLRIPVSPETRAEAQLATALAVLQQTPGVANARALDISEQQALLAPWFGPDVPVAILDLPQLVEVVPAADGYDVASLQEALAAAVPGAVLDDHGGWRTPLVKAASRLRLLGWGAAGLIITAVVAMVTLAVHASLAAHAQVITVLRLVGATDSYIARAFVRRFTLRALLGACGGTVAGYGATSLLPALPATGGVANVLGFPGASVLWLIAIPLACAVAAFWAARWAALRTVKETL